MASTSGTKPQSQQDNPILDSEHMPLSLLSLLPIFRVADDIKEKNPRVAYLCRSYALEKASKIDEASSGRGVRQFKTDLLFRLGREKDIDHQTKHGTFADPGDIQLFYKKLYKNTVRDAEHKKRPDEMAKICRTATVLYEVLQAVVSPGKIDAETERYAKDVEMKRKQCEPYNILPLYTLGVKPRIMEFPEIEAAVHALRNVNNLPISTPEVPKDILDWLSSIFGFQKGNVANQREHLILLLANFHIRNNKTEVLTQLDNVILQQFKEIFFKNYSSWCKYLHCESKIGNPQGSDTQQLDLIYIGLYLLIWGEASNVRFMPECLCYIFHNMANEVYGILFSNIHPVSGVTYQSAARDEGSFLKEVISPIYQVLLKEVKRNKGGKERHSAWRNYDDLNEYFWSNRCFRLGWPMDTKVEIFRHSDAKPANERANQAAPRKWKLKTNFVEVRTFWHLYRNFDRMWIFFILAFQAMVIVAWSPSGSLAALFDGDVFKSVLSIFITYAFLNLLRATLDIILSWKAWKNLKFSQILRYLLKFAAAIVWAVVLPIGYSTSMQNPTGLVKFFSSWARDWRNQSFYNYAIALYLMPNLLAAIMFLFPPLRKRMELSNERVITFLMWWAQASMYTLFWSVLIVSKLAFSYYVEILPLVGPTKLIMEIPIYSYQWHEFFPNGTHNIGVVIAIWAPIVLVYFMDAQIWYAIFSTIFGGIQGAFSYLGEIRTLGLLRSMFEVIPAKFSRQLMPPDTERKDSGHDEARERKNIANFSQVWNEFIYSMRMEDLISNRDRDLLLFRYPSNDITVVQWPPFLLASKIPIALDMAKDFKGKDDEELFKKIKGDDYMHSAVIECYETVRDIIFGLLEDEADKKILRRICCKVGSSIQQNSFLNNFKMSELPMLSEKLEKFLKLLQADSDNISESQIINVLQDIFEILTKDIMVGGHESFESAHPVQILKKEQRFEKLNIDLIENKSWREKVVRLYLLLTVKESAINVPQNLEARRRITFFANSLFMNMPSAPKVRDMMSFSVLTPYYKEDVLYSEEELEKENEDGISTVFYLQKIYPDEWTNFLERIQVHPEDERKDLTRHWVSYRGQTLSRTVRGMMYYRKALELQCFLEYAGDEVSFRDYREFKEKKDILDNEAQALVDLKFTYVVSCQVYGNQKKSDDPKDQNCYRSILRLLLKYPSLRVAYIDETEEKKGRKSMKSYFSVLVKGGDGLDEEVYRIRLPGSPVDIGEGKPENQNHAIIFTRGEALQTIDMNQDNYFEEAFKMRNVMKEFLEPLHGQRKPTILGLREHIFTGSVSSLAWFMSNQETSFVTIGQRILANPLRVRFHYGHPDIFDRIFHITRGGISKASKGINLSEDIFAGFNSTLREGLITHHEYIQVGKGREVGMNQISLFEAKVASGNGEQTLSRDVYRLGRRFDFYRMLSFYFTTVGFYFNSMMTMLIVFVFLYGRFYMVMSGVEREILKNPSIQQSTALEKALAIQSISQMGLLLALPMVMEIALEKGFRIALADLIIMQLQLTSVFFTFQLGTKAHYYGRIILHGGLWPFLVSVGGCFSCLKDWASMQVIGEGVTIMGVDKGASKSI
ncbi:hypothetical protein FH972_024983 [Carpinus fangiana]|uniref:1,3-beta-glucan synthase n=1 Tax=Carpinus fangiana TaxID=176857 RepID=A0A5N6L095_9ROSI|nr:hypothetical protein FH972_024983 [Carpinus fangiana]